MSIRDNIDTLKPHSCIKGLIQGLDEGEHHKNVWQINAQGDRMEGVASSIRSQCLPASFSGLFN